jgi:ribonuclease J
VKPQRIFDEGLAESPGAWVLFGAFQGHVAHLLKAGLLDSGAVVWSMWDGYLTDHRGQQFAAALEQAGVPLIHHHTSGHASPGDLKRLATVINPRSIVPIHTEAPERYAAALSRPVIQHPDGAWWSVC